MRKVSPKFPLILIPGFLVLLLGIFFFFFLIWRVSGTLSEQILYREEMAAESGANSLNVFLDNLGFQLSIFATRISIVNPNAQDTPRALKNLLDGMSETPMAGVMLADSTGKVLYGYERPGPFKGGEDISDREYFRWAKAAKEGQVFVGSPVISKLGFSKGQYIVPVATPVFRGGDLSGLVVVAVFVDKMMSQYLDDLKTHSTSRVYLVAENGVIVASPIKELLGVNYPDYIKNSNFADNDKVIYFFSLAMASEKSGTIDIDLPDELNDKAPSRFLIGYAPVIGNNYHWLVVVATPASEALASLDPLYFRDLGIIILVVLVTLVVAVFLDKVLNIIRKKTRKH